MKSFALTLSSSNTGHSKFSSYSSTKPLSLAILDTSCHFMEHFFAISAQIFDLPTPGVPALKSICCVRIFGKFRSILKRFSTKKYLPVTRMLGNVTVIPLFVLCFAVIRNCLKLSKFIVLFVNEFAFIRDEFEKSSAIKNCQSTCVCLACDRNKILQVTGQVCVYAVCIHVCMFSSTNGCVQCVQTNQHNNDNKWTEEPNCKTYANDCVHMNVTVCFIICNKN